MILCTGEYLFARRLPIWVPSPEGFNLGSSHIHRLALFLAEGLK